MSTVEEAIRTWSYCGGVSFGKAKVLTRSNILIPLDLSNRQITAFPNQLFSLDKPLDTLNLSHNQISAIPSAIKSLGGSGVRQLNVSNNHIESVAYELGTIPSLVVVNLSFNLLKEIPSSIYNLTNLTNLDLSNNKIETIGRTINKLESLIELNLSNNFITGLPEEILSLNQLEVLNLSCNRIRQLPRNISLLKKIRILNVKNNQIQDFPATIGLLSNLEKFNFKGNPFCGKYPRLDSTKISKHFREILRANRSTRHLLYSEPEGVNNIISKPGEASLSAISIEKLICYITRPGTDEDAALGVVGILYSYFTTLEKLLEALILRVTFPDPIYPDDKKQLKVISVLLSLLKQWTADNICLSNEFIVAFVEFVNGLDTNYEEQAKQLIQTLLENATVPPDTASLFNYTIPDSTKIVVNEAAASKIYPGIIIETPVKNSGKLPIFKLAESIKTLVTGVHQNHILYVPAEGLAAQICLRNSQKFVALQKKEFLHLSWNNPGSAPGINSASSYSTDISNWIITWILTQDDIKMRTKVCAHFLDVASHLIALGDFAGVVTFAAAFGNAAIGRLAKTLDGLDNKRKATLDEINNIANPTGNYKHYVQLRREQLQKVGFCVPFLVNYLGQLTSIEEVPNYKSTNVDLINFEKLKNIYKIVMEIEAFQNNTYANALEHNQEIDDFISSSTRINDEHEQFAVSLRCEASARKLKTSMHAPNDDENSLTQKDWKLLETGAQELTINSDETLTTLGEINHYLFRLKSGALNVILPGKDDGVPRVVQTITQKGAVIGEMSVLGNLAKATATIVAKPGSVISKINVQFIFQLFETEYDLARKFYINFGRKLATMLQEVSSVKKEEKILETNSSQSKSLSDLSAPGTLEKEFSNRFNRYEIIIKHFSATLKKKIPRKGTLYLTQGFIYFYAKIFKQVTKTIIPVSNAIPSVVSESKGKKVEIVTPEKKYSFLFSTEDAETAYNLIMQMKKLNVNAQASQEPEPERNVVTDRLVLTPREWNFIIKGNPNWNPHYSFSKGEVIIQENGVYSIIGQIASGVCSIEKQTENGTIALGKIGEGEIFGEIQFLTSKSASASVIADSDVEMYIIDGDFVAGQLFQTDPKIVIKFYHYLCVTIAKRINLRESEGWRRS